jgi:hypothetical protein
VSAEPKTSAVLLPFIRPDRTANRMTARDRIEAHDWHNSPAAAGYTRIAVDNSASEGEPELGDFLLLYTPDKLWARWGVGCCDGGFIVWRPGDGTTLGWYPSMRAALAAVPPAG